MKPTQYVAILDFGSQYTQLLATLIRNLGVYSQIFQPTVDVGRLENCIGIILSGGPNSVYADSAPPFNKEVLDMNCPILGLCYGLQFLWRRSSNSSVDEPR
jgi:GMP synthase (glutamine-hydrolysing)